MEQVFATGVIGDKRASFTSFNGDYEDRTGVAFLNVLSNTGDTLAVGRPAKVKDPFKAEILQLSNLLSSTVRHRDNGNHSFGLNHKLFTVGRPSVGVFVIARNIQYFRCFAT